MKKQDKFLLIGQIVCGISLTILTSIGVFASIFINETPYIGHYYSYIIFMVITFIFSLSYLIIGIKEFNAETKK